MTGDHMADPRDAILHLSAQNAGSREVEEFLRYESARIGSRIFNRIMKRIRHEKQYHNGKLTFKAKLGAATMLAVLALLFCVIGYCAALLVAELTADKNTEELFSGVATENVTEEPHSEITEFRTPAGNGIISVKVLVKSSLLYNAEITTDEGIVYYTQRPLSKQIAEDAEQTENIPHRQADFHLVIGGNTAEVYVTKHPDGEKTFELCWSDKQCSYSIASAKSIECAAQLAQSTN